MSRHNPLTTHSFIEAARKIHGNKYNYSKSIYENYYTNINIMCPIHGEFHQHPNNHLKGCGCKECGKEKTISHTKSNVNEFIRKSKNIYKNKYDYSKVVYINNHTKIKIICPIHGEFLQTPHGHIVGGCQKCGRDKSSISKKLSIKLFINRSKNIHGDKYDYSKVNYINARKNVIIICPIHGEFLQTPENHLRGNKCPMCRMSRGESKIIKFLEENKVGYISQKKFDNCINPKTNRKLKFDFYIPSKNLLIEYDGKQHFKLLCINGNYRMTNQDLKENKYRDKLKTQYSKKSGIRLLRIKYTKLDKIDQILKSSLNA